MTLANNLDLSKHDYGQAVKYLEKNIACQKWRSVFKQNLEQKGDKLEWKANIADLNADMNTFLPNVATWHEHYGLWPGQALAIFSSYSRWVHLSTNTLPFYWVMPRLQDEFPSTSFNTFNDYDESPMNHWPHENKNGEMVWTLSQRIWRWLKAPNNLVNGE